MGEIVHIAGLDIRIGDQLRQRCGWCGAVLLDYDLTRIAVASSEEPFSGPGTWPVGKLVAKDGGMSFVVEHNDGESLPDNCCGQLPHDVTGSVPNESAEPSS